jgi:hypothetical protein
MPFPHGSGGQCPTSKNSIHSSILRRGHRPPFFRTPICLTITMKSPFLHPCLGMIGHATPTLEWRAVPALQTVEMLGHIF